MKTKLINEMLRHSSTRILLDHQKRFRNCFKIIYNFRKDIATSHTPPSNRKSSIRIILERIYLNSRYGYTGVPCKGYKIPFFEEAIAQCLYIHNKMQGLYSIGWDIAITPNGPMIIELNDNWEIQPLEIVTERGWRKEYIETFVQTARKLRAHTA